MHLALERARDCVKPACYYMGGIMEFLHQLIFASEAKLLALAGLGCWVFAVFCLVMDRRRETARSIERLEKVGWVPWTALFMASAITGGGCLAMSLPVVLGSSL